jgi:hypothetical protein
MRSPRFIKLFAALCLMLLTSQPLWAAARAPASRASTTSGTVVVKLGTFVNWQSFAYKENGRKVCYMVTHLKQPKPNSKVLKTKKTASRGDVYLMVTLRPAETTNPVVSYRSGYLFHGGSEVALAAGKNNYKLFTEHDQAWARSSSVDRALTTSFRKEKQASVTGMSEKSTTTTDVFPILGGDAAYKAIAKSCGLNAK